MAIGIFL
ncbi:uncharacterized protein FFC1_15922 [Fusarium fujikuroi]|nr:uncharacterized protein FFC1_15922 [Fusarium fujikuroi]